MSAEQPMGSVPAKPSLAEALHGVTFPISRDELLNRHGEVEIQFTEGRVQTLSQALAGVEQPEFKSVSDVTLLIGEMAKR